MTILSMVTAAVLACPLATVADENKATSATVGVGIDPAQSRYAGATDGETPPYTERTSPQDWSFGFHGSFKAPARMSFDHHQVTQYKTDDEGLAIVDGNGNAQTKEPFKDWQFNMAPNLPDTNYSDWKYTNNLVAPFAEVMFSIGNSVATGTISIAAENITDAGWRNLAQQLGVNEAFLTLSFPEVFGSRGGLFLNAGIFGNRYGGMGRFDAGRYDTYIFGQTHLAGETLTAKLALTDTMALVIEHGFGATADVLPGNPKDNDTYSEDANFDWIPYAGAWGELPGMVNHLHAGLVLHSNKLFKELMINVHFLHAFTNSEDKEDKKSATADPPYHQPDGKQIVVGAEVKANGAVFGDLFFGFSHLKTDGLARMPDVLELLHSPGGWNMLRNFYGDQTLTTGSATRPDPNPGTGNINTLAWQYMFSLGRLLYFLEGKEFWGQGPDVQISLWGMLNLVDPDKALRPKLHRWAEKKLKIGAEAFYTPLKYLGMGFRFDRVMPDLDYDSGKTERNDSSTSSYAPFSVISPMIRVKTAFLTREEVTLQYSRYLWEGDREEVRSERPHLGQRSDRNALMLNMSMWW
jgi:hypothetical protein